jgi:hypothetical protein
LELPNVSDRRTDTSYEKIPTLGEYLMVQTNQSSASEFWVQTSIAYRSFFKIFAYVQYLHGAETWTLRKIDQNCLESFEMWCRRRLEKISWNDRVRNKVL